MIASLLFYETILLKSKNIPSILEPTLPRKTRALTRFEIGTGIPSYPEKSRDYYKRIYFEALDLIINAIEAAVQPAKF